MIYLGLGAEEKNNQGQVEDGVSDAEDVDDGRHPSARHSTAVQVFGSSIPNLEARAAASEPPLRGGLLSCDPSPCPAQPCWSSEAIGLTLTSQGSNMAT